jgi:curved DNA-binding protein CbpA
MAPLDPYRVLMVHPEADAEIIQAAYRKLAQRYHPDVATSPDAVARMAELNAARDLLLDPVRRGTYDRKVSGAAGAPGAPPSEAASPEPTGAATAGPTGNTYPFPASAGQVNREAATAGPPPGDPSGSLLSFGRYAGWSLGEVARFDLEYIEWLDRMPIGRNYRSELDMLLRQAGRRGLVAAEGARRRAYGRR